MLHQGNESPSPLRSSGSGVRDDQDSVISLVGLTEAPTGIFASGATLRALGVREPGQPAVAVSEGGRAYARLWQDESVPGKCIRAADAVASDLRADVRAKGKGVSVRLEPGGKVRACSRARVTMPRGAFPELECAHGDHLQWLQAAARAHLRRRLVPPGESTVVLRMMGGQCECACVASASNETGGGDLGASEALEIHDGTSVIIAREGRDDGQMDSLDDGDAFGVRNFSTRKCEPRFSLKSAAAGKPKVASEVMREIVGPLLHYGNHALLGWNGAPGMLVTGQTGVGKSVLTEGAAGEAGALMVMVEGAALARSEAGEAEREMERAFESAEESRPCVVVLEGVDSIAPKRGEGGPAAARATASLLRALDCRSHLVAVIAITDRPEGLDQAVRRPGRLESELELGVPGRSERESMMHHVFKVVRHRITEQGTRRVADEAKGFVPADAEGARDEAAIRALEEGETSISEEQAISAIRSWRPINLREAGEEISTCSWEDIGGQESAKLALQEALSALFGNDDRSESSVMGGVLLYGPPGCSKTLLARAAAGEAGANLLAVKGPEMYSKYVGESEKAIRSLFRRARACSPALILIDEADGLAPPRGSGAKGEEVSTRVLSQLLSEIDSGPAQAGVLVIAATNRPDMLDSALLRPGRLGRRVFVAPPQSEEERLDVLQALCRRMPIPSRECALRSVAASAKAQGMSGADLAKVAREAALDAISRTENGEELKITEADLLAALDCVPPSAHSPLPLDALYRHHQRGAHRHLGSEGG